MKARLLKLSNFPGMLVIALFALTIQSTLFNHPSIAFFQPDLIIFFVVWVAIRRTFIEGGILTLLFGYLVELHSAAPQGFYLSIYMAIYLTSRFLYQQFQISNKKVLLIVGIGFAVLMRFLILFILFLMNRADNVWNHTLQLMAPTIFSHALMIFLVFKVLLRFDNWTLKNPDAERHHERNFHLDGELV
jgi:cell shape-determining protein MreD